MLGMFVTGRITCWDNGQVHKAWPSLAPNFHESVD